MVFADSKFLGYQTTGITLHPRTQRRRTFLRESPTRATHPLLLAAVTKGGFDGRGVSQ